ncbi:MAG TPA: hypothetical protein VF633_04590 [Brevundimonas sp.]|jgi:hypothetical protein
MYDKTTNGCRDGQLNSLSEDSGGGDRFKKPGVGGQVLRNRVVRLLDNRANDVERELAGAR